MVQEYKRAGGKYEAAGTIAILIGMGACMATGGGGIGWMLVIGGFIVFLIGRFQ